MGHTCGPIRGRGRLLPYLVLLQAGFAVPPSVATGAVRSYRTLSPLPPPLQGGWRFAFCCTFRGLAPPRRYLAPCPGSPDFPPRLRAAIVWPTPAAMVVGAGRENKGKVSTAASVDCLAALLSFTAFSLPALAVVQLAALAAGDARSDLRCLRRRQLFAATRAAVRRCRSPAPRSSTARRSRRSRSRRASCRCRAPLLRSARASVPLYVVSKRFVSSRLIDARRSAPKMRAMSRRTSASRCGAS